MSRSHFSYELEAGHDRTSELAAETMVLNAGGTYYDDDINPSSIASCENSARNYAQTKRPAMRNR